MKQGTFFPPSVFLAEYVGASRRWRQGSLKKFSCNFLQSVQSNKMVINTEVVKKQYGKGAYNVLYFAALYYLAD